MARSNMFLAVLVSTFTGWMGGNIEIDKDVFNVTAALLNSSIYQ